MMNEQQGRNINMHVSGTNTLQQGCAAASPAFEKSLLLTSYYDHRSAGIHMTSAERETQV